MSGVKEIRSLRSMRSMPMPNHPQVGNYGAADCGDAHDVRLYPAILRKRNVLAGDALLEAGQSTCFFHPDRPAVTICAISGRMICDLCATEWEGQPVSFEALQTVVLKDADKRPEKGRMKWDDVALALAILPVLFWFVTILTAPLVLGICLWCWRQGVTSPVRRSRWRYLVAGSLAVVQIGFWFWLLVFGWEGL